MASYTWHIHHCRVSHVQLIEFKEGSRSRFANHGRMPSLISTVSCPAVSHGDGSDYVHVAARTADERYEQRKAARLSLDTSFPGAAIAAAAARRAEDEGEDLHADSGRGPMEVPPPVLFPQAARANRPCPSAVMRFRRWHAVLDQRRSAQRTTQPTVQVVFC